MRERMVVCVSEGENGGVCDHIRQVPLYVRSHR